MRLVENKEVFPNRQLPLGTPENLPTFDLTYDPTIRGPYNYLPAEGIGPIPGLNPDGTLQAPEERWGGIQRALLTTDFELSNVEYIQFWVMDPFNEDSQNDTGGELYLNLGSISEDLLNDGQLAFENGLPSANQPAPVQESTWGQVADPSTFNVVHAFDNSTGDYSLQDVGLDGLNSQEEQEFFGDWLTGLQDDLEPEAYDAYRADPSADDFRYFRDPVAQANEENVLERYRFFNGYEGNSSTAQPEGYPIASTTLPNTEDITEDLTLSAIESYFQYRIPLRPGSDGSQHRPKLPVRRVVGEQDAKWGDQGGQVAAVQSAHPRFRAARGRHQRLPEHPVHAGLHEGVAPAGDPALRPSGAHPW